MRQIRHQLFLTEALSAQLEALAAKPGVTKSAILGDAVAAWLNRRAASELDERFATRLDRMTQAIGRVDRRSRRARLFDDGTKTYVEFPASILQREVPPLFTIGADGEPELVNYRMRGRYFVVDRLFDAAELRLGLKKQQVVRIDRVTRLAKWRGA